MKKRIKMKKLTLDKWVLIICALDKNNNYNILKISRQVNISYNHTGNIINILVSLGLVSRSNHDLRSYSINLTEKGQLLQLHCLKLIEALNSTHADT
jgi:predicted transcriptional regulator